MATGVSKRDVREHATKGGHKRECPMCALCALCAHSVYALCALCMRSVCALCALSVRSVCTMCARCLHDVCTMCAAHRRSARIRPLLVGAHSRRS